MQEPSSRARSNGMPRWVARIALALLASIALSAAALSFASVRRLVHENLPRYWIAHVKAVRQGIRADYGVRIPMPDGVRLAASLYRPRSSTERLPTILLRLPYNRLESLSALTTARYFASRGYAVLVQDIRGKYGSEGEFIPYRSATSDGVATLEWIAAQPWSNGRVGTFGCSAEGELQLLLARAHHPAHRAMIASAAGGALGSAFGRYGYFGVFEGGIFQLSSGFGWFVVHGSRDLRTERSLDFDVASALRRLPVVKLVDYVRGGTNTYREFVSTALTDPWWQGLEYVSDADRLTVPAMIINTWGDQTVGDTLTMAEWVRRTWPREAAHQHVIISAGNHCDHETVSDTGRFGELEVRGTEQPYWDWYLRWFDHWLRDGGGEPPALPAYLYYMVGEHRWLSASSWPPPQSRPQRWYLTSGGHANTRSGDGALGAVAASPGFDEYRYDPTDPVPSLGGPLCCSGDPSQRSGPADQRQIEQRQDVLVYTSTPLSSPLRIAGPLRAHLSVSSSARDTDFVARLVHVWPDGRATSVQEGALRARYRTGIARPTLLEPGRIVELDIDMRSMAYTIPAGHRLSLQVTSSSFPRLERNLNTGGRNFDETLGVVATNRVHHGTTTPSYLELPVLPAAE